MVGGPLNLEIDVYTPPVLRGAVLVAVQRQRCIKFRVLIAVAELQKGQHLPALERYINQSPIDIVL